MSEWPPIYLVSGLHADVDAQLEQAVVEQRRPGVVIDHERVAQHAPRRRNHARMSGISKDCEPGASTSTARVFSLNSFFDAGADHRIVIGGLDAIAGASRPLQKLREGR